MTDYPIERRLRAGLPFTRFITAYLPLPIARWLIGLGQTQVKLPVDVIRKSVSADGVPGDWLIPAGAPSAPVLLYLHGGGFVFGVTALHLAMVARLAQLMGIRALMVDYRLAPEHPHPAALDDCLTVYDWLVQQGIAGQRIVVAGDSAGGNLALTMSMALRDRGKPLPAAVACLSPVTDFTQPNSRFRDRHDPVLHPRATDRFDRAYVADRDPRTPTISPVFGEWSSLPPLLIHAGEDEVLRDDALHAARLAEAAGVDVHLEIYPRMWHVWQIFPDLPQTEDSLQKIAHFLISHLGSAPPSALPEDSS